MKKIIIFIFSLLIMVGGISLLKNSIQTQSPVQTTSEKNNSPQKKFSVQEYRKTIQEFKDITEKENPLIALTELRTRTESDNALARSCHNIAHEIGHTAFAKYGDFATTMHYQDDICNSGYIHGVIEDYFTETKDPVADMYKLCAAYPKGSFIQWECFHGIGHGIMFYTENDLPKSLSLCETYSDSLARSSCVNGVFMQNFDSDPELHPSSFVKDDDSFYPCEEQKDEYKGDCYMYAPTHYLNLHENNYAGALQWCLNAESGYRYVCESGVGSQTIKENMNNPKFAESICLSGKPEQISPCIQGMTTFSIYHFGSTENGKTFCLQLEDANKNTCLTTVQSIADFINK